MIETCMDVLHRKYAWWTQKLAWTWSTTIDSDVTKIVYERKSRGQSVVNQVGLDINISNDDIRCQAGTV